MVDMQKVCETAVNLLVAGTLVASAAAQQTTAPTSSTPKTGTATAAHRRTTVAAKPKALVPVTEKDKQSYSIGLSVGKGLHRDEIDVEPDFLMQGVKDALAGGKVQLTDDQIKTVMMDLQKSLQEKQEEKRKVAIVKNKQDGAAFMAANAKAPGVVTLPSGLQYKILTPGTGPKPTADDSVVCNYSGKLLDGTEFDSSYKRGQPATFRVGQVIKGWTEALQLMPVGSKWQLVIPPDLAYGERGSGPIGPNSTLKFDVELMSIAPKTPAQAPQTPQSAPQSQKPQN